MSQSSGVTEAQMTTPISIPSPALFLNQSLIKPGILRDLITTIIPVIDSSLPKDETKWDCKHPEYPKWGRTYGGIFIVQSMACVLLSLNDPSRYYIHQLQSIFIRGGTEGENIQYRVKFLKNSKAFINTKVDAFQNGKLLFTALISLITPDEGNKLSHFISPYGLDTKALPHPDTLPLYTHDLYNISRTGTMLKDPTRQKMVLGQTLTMPTTMKLITRENADVKYWLSTRPLRQPRILFYVRYPNNAEITFQPSEELKKKFTPQQQLNNNNDTNINLNNDNTNATSNGNNNVNNDNNSNTTSNHVTLEQHLNILSIAYSSDYMAIQSLLLPQDLDAFPMNIQFSSLNHNITFMSPTANIFDDWLVLDSTAPFLSNSRGQLVSTFYNRDGNALAYVTQEALARVLEGNVLDKFPNPMKVGNDMAERNKARHGGKNIGAFGMKLDTDLQQQAKL